MRKNTLWTLSTTCLLVGLLLAGCSGAAPAAATPEAATETAEPVEAGPKEYDLPADAAGVANPVPVDAASLARGAEVYGTSCHECHGDEGRGDGPAAVRQNPPTGDFTAPYAQELTDGEIFYIITNGSDGTGMRSFAFFEEEDRWHLVNHIRSLQE